MLRSALLTVALLAAVMSVAPRAEAGGKQFSPWRRPWQPIAATLARVVLRNYFARHTIARAVNEAAEAKAAKYLGETKLRNREVIEPSAKQVRQNKLTWRDVKISGAHWGPSHGFLTEDMGLYHGKVLGERGIWDSYAAHERKQITKESTWFRTVSWEVEKGAVRLSGTAIEVRPRFRPFPWMPSDGVRIAPAEDAPR